MNRLHELQREFTGFVLGGQEMAPSGVRANGIEPDRRLAIYRNNTIQSLTEALGGVYPVIRKLVGGDFFLRLGRDYIRRHPPRSGCLLTFGREFPDFLESYRPAGGLPYLGDTARLEWYRHEVYHEADDVGLETAALAQVPEASYGGLKFRLHPAVRLLASDYPIERIWRANQKDNLDGGPIDLNEGGCRLLVFRPVLTVAMETLDLGRYRFLTELKSGLTLMQAVSDACREDSRFEVAKTLRFCFEKGLFTGFYSV
jgi:hypothetical protein